MEISKKYYDYMLCYVDGIISSSIKALEIIMKIKEILILVMKKLGNLPTILELDYRRRMLT